MVADKATAGIDSSGTSGMPISMLMIGEPSQRVGMSASSTLSSREGVNGLALLMVGAAVTLLSLRSYIGEHIQARDFKLEYWVAGLRVLHGHSPYVWHAATPAIKFPYPALSALLFVPFGLLSRTDASAIFTILCIASPLLALRVLRVRDRRVYGLVLVWAPVLTGWQSANLTLPLTLGMAVLWRYRDRPVVAGILTAILISLKPVVWPIALWILVTRRVAAAGWAILAGAALNLIAWSVLGFNLISSYLHQTGLVTKALHSVGYSLQSIALRCGLGDLSGPIVVACCLVIFVLMLRRRHDDASALTLTMVMMLVSSPVVWNQYFAYMLVPMAVVMPRLNRVWFAPVAMFVLSANGLTWWEPWVFWIVTLYVTVELLDRASDTFPSKAATRWWVGWRSPRAWRRQGAMRTTAAHCGTSGRPSKRAVSSC